jgi:hypothetical protein
MSPVFIALVALVGSTFQTRSAMQAEIAALRHQLAVLQRSAPRRPRLKQSDRVLWILLSRLWPDWRHGLRILKPDTVVGWHRRGFVGYWTWKSRRRPGRPRVASAIRDLIQQMCQANVPVSLTRSRPCLITPTLILCLPRIVSVALNANSCGTLIADLIDELALLTVALGGLAVSASPRRVPPSAGSPFCERTQFCISKSLVGEVKEKRHFRSRKAEVDATGLLRLS